MRAQRGRQTVARRLGDWGSASRSSGGQADGWLSLSAEQEWEEQRSRRSEWEKAEGRWGSRQTGVLSGRPDRPAGPADPAAGKHRLEEHRPSPSSFIFCLLSDSVTSAEGLESYRRQQ